MKLQNRIADYLPPALRPQAGGSSGQGALPDVRELAQRAEQIVKEHPGPALGAAFVLGVVVAWFIKRM